MTMSRERRHLLGPAILAALLILAAILAAISARQRGSSGQPPVYPTYNVHSSAPEGTRALSLWLSDIGYTSSTLEYHPFELSSRDTLLFMLFPSLDPTSKQINDLVGWVRQGGTLVVASGYDNDLLDRLGVVVSPIPARKADVSPVQPALSNPPMTETTLNVYGTLTLRDPSWIPMLDERPTGEVIAASRIMGRGMIYVLTTGDPFSNSGLSQQGNRSLMLNVLASIPSASTVVIDEYHHGFTEQGTFTYQLFRQPWGWAILYLAAMVFVFIALNGRRFGRTVRPYAHAMKRARSEFAETLASMLHHSGQRAWLRDHYLEQIKHSLGARFRVRSNLPTSVFVEQLAQRNPNAVALCGPLEQLEAERVPDEAQLVTLVRETEVIAAKLMEHPRAIHAAPQSVSGSSDQQITIGKTGT